MSYNYATDFIGLLRLVGSSVRSERMPGLDYVVAALSRAGLFAVSVGQAAPTVNQASTLWFQPAIPSWGAEGTVWLWNAAVPGYQVATPALWSALLSGAVLGYSFQSLPNANNVIGNAVSLAAVQRVAPAATNVVLPNLALYHATGLKLQVVDFSTGVVNHIITLTTSDGATIMQRNSWQLGSNAAQLSGVMLTASPDLDSWIIAP
jgi:hypothetical protein